jgi:hypothetical protein
VPRQADKERIVSMPGMTRRKKLSRIGNIVSGAKQGSCLIGIGGITLPNWERASAARISEGII